jgi:hypothetical protein
LGGSGCGSGLAAGDAYNSQDSDFNERCAGDEDAVGGGIQVGGRDLQAVIEERKQIVGDNAFQCFAVGVAQANPEAVELGATQKRFALRLEFIGKLANEINGADFRQRKLEVLAIGGKNVNGIGLSEARGVQVAAQGLLVGEHNNDLLVRRGWGFNFQNSVNPGPGCGSV